MESPPPPSRSELPLAALLALAAGAGVGAAARAAEPLEFTRMVAHWSNYGSPDYLAFIDEARPELVQVGFYGGHFYSLVHTPQYGGYPANFPVRGLEEGSRFFSTLNAEIHRRGAKVVGHFNVEFLVGDPDSPEGPRGFFRYYRDLWDEALLGPKPEADPTAFLERRGDGAPISEKNYSIGGMREYWACLRNPAWQQVLRAWVRRTIALGVDGLVANYFYRHDCLCRHCQRAFRDHLRSSFDAAELKARFGIDDLESHVFTELVSWHDPKQSTPLRREMLRFSQISNKRVYDQIFLEYARSLKPDFIAAQWNHLGDFGQIQGDERCFLPAELWGRGEDYLWYSLGGAANFTDLARGFLGEGTLQARYIRGAFQDKPFTLGKYESSRIQVSIAELAANGGAPMGFYTDFSSPVAREIIVRYYRFLARHDAIFRAHRSAAEALLLFPRRAVHAGDLAPLAAFREAGRALLEAHALFDVLPDDLASPERLGRYRRVFRPTEMPGDLKDALKPLSRLEAERTVRFSASQPDKNDRELDLHLVNYNRVEPPRGADGQPSPGSGAQDERPIPCRGVQVQLLFPAPARVQRIELLTPERVDPVALPVAAGGPPSAGVSFDVPEFVVYAVVRVITE